MTATGSAPLRRFWIEFGPTGKADREGASRSRMYGVTAATLAETLALLQHAIFRDDPLPPVECVIEDIDVAMLDAFHIGPGVLPPNRRGIWYPPVGPWPR